jgi:hypothetical protein
MVYVLPVMSDLLLTKANRPFHQEDQRPQPLTGVIAIFIALLLV